MKNFKKLLMIAVVFSLVLTACKYEEGPGISFRNKRERISNIWKVTNYKTDGADNDSLKRSFYSGDSIQIVFSISQSGNYSLNLQYTEEYSARTNYRKHFIANQTGNVSLYFEYNKNSFFQRVGGNGKWTFDKKHDDIHFGTNDLSKSEGQKKPLICKIVMLRNKMLKLSFMSDDGKKHLITFEPAPES